MKKFLDWLLRRKPAYPWQRNEPDIYGGYPPMPFRIPPPPAAPPRPQP